METKTINKIPALTWNWLKMNAGEINIPESLDTAEPTADGNVLNFEIKSGVASTYENEISTKENENKTVIMNYEGESDFFSVKTTINLAPNSSVHLVKVQLLSKNTIHSDETTVKIGDGAKFNFTQIELGGKETFAELKAELTGAKSFLKTDTAYLCAESQNLDINYLATHTGRETECVMNAKGVLDGDGKKIYRGTIDFKNGCSGSKGNEMEETLIMSPAAVNKSIPIILCDEEDVEGEHGATIGRLGSDELFYMQSRGISEDEAKKMMSHAKIMSVAALTESPALQEKIENFLSV